MSTLQRHVESIAFDQGRTKSVYVEEVLCNLIILWNNSEHEDDLSILLIFIDSTISLTSSLSFKPVAVRKEIVNNLFV